jgi:hypothetical protein
MRFAANHSEPLEDILLSTDGISGHFYVSQAAICEMATVQVRAFLDRTFQGR